MPYQKACGARFVAERIRIHIAHADNLSQEREYEHFTIAVTVYVGVLSSPQPTRAETSIGTRRAEHAMPGAKQGAARGVARTMSCVLRGFERNVALQDPGD